jgi:hypothetical protein
MPPGEAGVPVKGQHVVTAGGGQIKGPGIHHHFRRAMRRHNQEIQEVFNLYPVAAWAGHRNGREYGAVENASPEDGIGSCLRHEQQTIGAEGEGFALV